MFVNCGILINGSNAKSKKAIKDAILVAPETVEWFGTSMFQIGANAGLVTDLAPGVTLNFCGPDPFTKRSFYGSIKLVNLKLKVS